MRLGQKQFSAEFQTVDRNVPPVALSKQTLGCHGNLWRNERLLIRVISEGINKETMDPLGESSDQELHGANVRSAAASSAFCCCFLISVSGWKMDGLKFGFVTGYLEIFL